MLFKLVFPVWTFGPQGFGKLAGGVAARAGRPIGFYSSSRYRSPQASQAVAAYGSQSFQSGREPNTVTAPAAGFKHPALQGLQPLERVHFQLYIKAPL